MSLNLSYFLFLFCIEIVVFDCVIDYSFKIPFFSEAESYIHVIGPYNSRQKLSDIVGEQAS